MNRFKKVLVANRGEIAVRIIRCLKEMGILSVAVYSDADRDALHTQLSDETVYIGKPEPLKSYLNIPGIIDAARSTQCQAIHPGYGFLAENPNFADACKYANIVFIGPSSKSMAVMGDKVKARRCAADVGVPVIPGIDFPTCDVEEFIRQASTIELPFLIKAAGGGGGKGMRLVRDRPELEVQAKIAIKEAEAAFGDGRIYAEKYLQKPRHIEFQTLSDKHGNSVHLYERECSVQRRFQKLLEESPSPAISQGQRQRMAEDTLKIIKASEYEGAGTVEFLYIDDSHYYFLEMNTRIQVEHPVTEMVTGIDLLRAQVNIAQNEILPFSQDDIPLSGHAIEARIYAEDPLNDFAASPGRIIHLQWPNGPGVRIDEGIHHGSDVPVFYDPILAKIIVHGQKREHAISRMKEALNQTRILGVQTTAYFLSKLINSPEFKEGLMDITLLETIKDKINIIKPEILPIALAFAGYMAKSDSPDSQARSKQVDNAASYNPWNTIGAWEIVKGAK